VFGGQTITVNVKLTPSAIQVGTISVTASNPIVPRDQVTSKSIVSGQLVNDLRSTMHRRDRAPAGRRRRRRGRFVARWPRSEPRVYRRGPGAQRDLRGDCTGMSQTCTVVTVGRTR
jgi:hypothetical protein